MEKMTLPKRAFEQYKVNFMVRVPVYDWYIEELEVCPAVEIDRIYDCLDCHDTKTVFDEIRGEVACHCSFDLFAVEPNKD